MKREEALSRFSAEAKKAYREIKKITGLDYLNEEFIDWGLIDYFDISDMPEELVFKKLDAKQIVSLCIENQLWNRLPIGSVVLEESILPEDSISDLEKARIKVKGEMWEIRYYDPDPFPSNPHAHNYQNNLRLHLGNGELYRRRQFVDRISKKKLLLIRNRIADAMRDLTLPNLTI